MSADDAPLTAEERAELQANAEAGLVHWCDPATGLRLLASAERLERLECQVREEARRSKQLAEWYVHAGLGEASPRSSAKAVRLLGLAEDAPPCPHERRLAAARAVLGTPEGRAVAQDAATDAGALLVRDTAAKLEALKKEVRAVIATAGQYDYDYARALHKALEASEA